jgi:magnesium-transporting ATPase (P-type)|tara:strand:- start:741 stop:1061 length:321 start_codon:yes stop_codon:yes gene_type:complete
VFSIIVLLLVSNLLILLATQLVNENNADLLLAGYNTMSKKEKEKFKLKEYLIFFKNFFFKLVLYSSLITIISSLFFDELYVVIIYSICILLPLPFFLIKSNKNFKK